MARHFKLTADGGSRGNPGPAGFGAVVSENGQIIAEIYEFIGTATNNVAEYGGLIAGLRAIHDLDNEATVEVCMDSKLVVEQMSGRWQIKHADMRKLAQSAREAHSPSLIKYQWIPRDENSHADRLANKALDAQSSGHDKSEPVQPRQLNYLTERLKSDEQPTILYLIRHGETVLTPGRKFSGIGPLNPILTETGRAQAEKVAEAVSELKPEVLIASPLNRTSETAKAIAQTTDLEINFDEIWLEMDFGYWDGLSVEEVKAQFPADYEKWVTDLSFQPAGGESWEAITIRVEAALSKILAEYPGQKVAVITHNCVIKTAVALCLSAPIESVFHMDIGPCSINTFLMWPSDGLRAVRAMNQQS
jgi:ribonuclease H / adenosylcobalamin/alpha-ribazole phosphatase